MPIRWFKRLADAPEVGYSGAPGIDREKLPGHDDEPQVQVWDFDGQPHEWVYWPLPGNADEQTSASPASQHSRPFDEDLPPEEIIQNAYEALELPGTLLDYHGVLWRAGAALRQSRRQDTRALDWVEQLYWLDLRLVGAFPEIIRDEYGSAAKYSAVAAFGGLIALYEREGHLGDALAVADLAARFDPDEPFREKLAAKLRSVEAEDVT